MLNTVEYGLIRVISASSIIRPYDSLLGSDLIGEWLFYSLASGEIVAVWAEDE